MRVNTNLLESVSLEVKHTLQHYTKPVAQDLGCREDCLIIAVRPMMRIPQV